MVKVVVGHHPELTAEDTMKIFQSHFAGKYEVYKTKMPGWAFVVKKSAWRAAGVKLIQKRNQTTFYLQGISGSTFVRMFWVLLFLMLMTAVFSSGAVGAGGFIGFILMVWLLSFVSQRPSHRLLKEIKAFIEQEFKTDLQNYVAPTNEKG